MTEGLFPPAGAEPGSLWTLISSQPDFRSYIRDIWINDGWGVGVTWSPSEMWRNGWRLDDPHGLAAAHRVMSEARLQLPAYEMLGADGRGADVWQAIGLDVAGDEIIGTGPSALAAALDAVRAMREVEGRT